MPTIEDYLPLAPYTLDELVSAVNSILRDRPSMHIQARTVRYYITNGILPPPGGAPKFARYSAEHLRRIVHVRRWLDEGLSLDQAVEKISLGSHGGETDTHKKRHGAQLQENRPSYGHLMQTSVTKDVRRIQVTRHCVVEIGLEADIDSELGELRRLLDTKFGT